MVFAASNAPNPSKVKKLDDLVNDLGSEISGVRDNEGEAATHGIYYDDSKYDYMQHMRDLGQGRTEGDSVWLEPKEKGKNDSGKGKVSLEDALRNASLEDDRQTSAPRLDGDVLPLRLPITSTYQSQQNTPDALAGFQPDMDHRLREVLEALEDEAYVEDDDDIFFELAKGAEEVDEEEFEQGFWDEDDQGWESDDTAKPVKEYKVEDVAVPVTGEDDGIHGDGEFMANFTKYKQDAKAGTKPTLPDQSEAQSSIMTTTTNGGRKKKRKGALTNQSAYSMTSSSLFRTEGLTDLDAHFDRIEARYNDDFDDMASESAASSIASTSSVTGPMRGDFDSIMDDFLGGYSMSGKKHVKKGRYQSGMEQLDEIRQGLGPARFRKQQA